MEEFNIWSEERSRMWSSQKKLWITQALNYLVQHDKITIKEMLRLQEMVDSSDSENLTVVESIINSLLKET